MGLGGWKRSGLTGLALVGRGTQPTPAAPGRHVALCVLVLVGLPGSQVAWAGFHAVEQGYTAYVSLVSSRSVSRSVERLGKTRIDDGAIASFGAQLFGGLASHFLHVAQREQRDLPSAGAGKVLDHFRLPG